MECAYPFKAGYRRGEHDPLKYSVRALYAHYPISRLWLFGDVLPEWVEPEAVEFVPTDQGSTKFANIGRNITAAARARGMADAFLWLNDDFFLLADHGEAFPLYCRRESLEDYAESLNNGGSPNPTLTHRSFVVGINRQADLLKQWGLEAPNQCAELHTPIPLIRARLVAILDRARRDMPALEAGHFRGLYGVGMPARPIADVKIKGQDELPPAGATMVSVAPESWETGAVGQYLRARYWRRSPFERGA
jgi:hypothetical protein